ncbi:MAG TPA: c-type cytochrome [Xanthomonadaceae bacterium]|nr:c-type cytochrome [Xanthomonadaceae bacterium]
MRERWVKLLVLLTAASVLGFATLFTIVQNGWPGAGPSQSPGPKPARVQQAPLDATRIARGRELIQSRGCLRCHAVGGIGNPRSPLDRAAARRDAAALREWTLATGEAADALPARARAVKQDYRDLPHEDLDALIAYLQDLD